MTKQSIELEAEEWDMVLRLIKKELSHAEKEVRWFEFKSKQLKVEIPTWVLDSLAMWRKRRDVLVSMRGKMMLT